MALNMISEPLEWTDQDPPFKVPEWSALGAAEIPASQMGRHTLIFGETGSGKTRSAILPLTAAVLAYGHRGKLQPAMLIIDPKNEIGSFVQDLLPEEERDRRLRILHPRQSKFVLDVFEGQDRASLQAADILQRLNAVIDTRPPVQDHGNSRFFDDKAKGVLHALIAVDVDMFRRGGPAGLMNFWNCVSDATGAGLSPGRSPIPLRADNYFSRYYALVAAMAAHAGTAQGSGGNPVVTGYQAACQHMELGDSILALPIAQLAALGWETSTSVIAGVENALRVYATADLARYLWLNPFEAPTQDVVSITEVMELGLVVCFRPDDTSEHDLTIGRALKAKFFELTFSRTARERPVVYICDEFQRFITSDVVSGEQSYLDRCRAFRGICILASQSLASLEYALGRDGHSDQDRASLQVMLNNTGNKLFFRSTDPRVAEVLEGLLPVPPVQRPHVVRVRPPATMALGECYYLFPSGHWGRAHVRLPSRDRLRAVHPSRA